MTQTTLHKCLICKSDKLLTYDEVASLSKCLSCGFVFDNPRPELSEIEKFYSRPIQYDEWLLNESLRDDLWRRRVGKMKRYLKGGSLLDIGTGIGQFLKHAQPYFKQVDGTEMSELAVKIAKERYGILVRHVKDLDHITSSQRYDVITLFHVLEHVVDPRKTIEDIGKLSAEEGLLFIAVPNDLQSLKIIIKKILRRLGLKKYTRFGPSMLVKITMDGSMAEIHLSQFTPQTLQKLLEGQGFKILENSLDPYFVASGVSLFRKYLYYQICMIIWHLLGVNIYDTIWIVARKAKND